MHHIKLAWRLEQHAEAMPRFAGCRLGGPGGVAHGFFKLCSVGGFILLPGSDVLSKAESKFGFRCNRISTQYSSKLLAEAININRFSCFRLHLLQGSALQEIAAADKERRQLMMFCRKRTSFSLNAEQGCDEII